MLLINPLRSVVRFFFYDCWAYASLVHKTPHVTVLFTLDDLAVCYKFDKAFAEVGLYFTYIDYLEANSGITLELNGSLMCEDGGNRGLTFAEFASRATTFLQTENCAVLWFTEIDYYSIQCYVCFTTLVRVEVFDWEEDYFFAEKEMLRRYADGICFPHDYAEKRLKTADTD